jgi:hypothetical protein
MSRGKYKTQPYLTTFENNLTAPQYDTFPSNCITGGSRAGKVIRSKDTLTIQAVSSPLSSLVSNAYYVFGTQSLSQHFKISTNILLIKASP